MKRFKVVEGRYFRTTIDQRASGLLGLEERFHELKYLLERNPKAVGTRENEEFPRYIVAIDAGTLDWKILVEYFVHEDSVELMQVI